MIRIAHPRPARGRQKFIGIEFRDGFATVESLHPEVEASLQLHGYEIEQIDEPARPRRSRRNRTEPVPPDPEDPPLPSYVVPLAPDEE